MNKAFFNVIFYTLIGIFAFFILENLNLYLIPFILFEILFIFSIIDLIQKKQKNLITVIISSIGNLVILLFFAFASEYDDYRENITVMIGLICFIIGLISFFKYLKDAKNQLSSTKVSSSFQEKKNSKKTFSIGITCKKWHQINIIYIISISILTVSQIALYIYFKKSIILLLAISLIILSFFIFIIFKAKADQKPLTNYSNSLDFEKLEKEINVIIDNPRVHFETKNYYLILLCATSLAVDYQKFKEYLELVKKPTFKSYEFSYDGLFLHCFLEKEEFINAYNSLYEKYKDNRTAIKAINNFYKQWKIVILNELDDDINKICPLDTKSILMTATNTYIQAMYFLNNNNIEKGIELANLFIKNYSSLKEFTNRLHEKLNQHQ